MDFRPPANILNDCKFANWFGESITKQNDLPIVFYHISKCQEKLTKFATPIFFTEARNKDQVRYIGFMGGIGDTRHEYLCYLKIENPYYYYDNANGLFDHNHNKIEIIDISQSLVSDLQVLGYDCIIIQRITYFNEYIIFNNSQIKSVENNGDFNNPNNIYK